MPYRHASLARFALVLRLPSLGAALVLAGCANSTSNGFNMDAGGGGGMDSGAADTSSPVDVMGGSDVHLQGDASAPDSNPNGFTLLYAHDKATLYKVDPMDPMLAITQVGAFDCVAYPPGPGQVASMTDLAVDKDGKLYGVATQTVFLGMQVSGSTVQCQAVGKALTGAQITQGDKFYGASFAPVGSIDPANETLVVGDTAGNMYAVDNATGALTIVGSFGAVPMADSHGNVYPNPGGAWEMSGDIVFLSNNGTPVGFATVRDCPNPPSATGCNPVDTLLEIDMTKLVLNNAASVTKAVRGQILKAAMGCSDTMNTGYGSMYGIAAYQDKVIGFSHSGFIVSISNVDGTACLIHDYSAQLMGGFDGAGVTTKAPVKPPPPPH